jgi:hypothetical protein
LPTKVLVRNEAAFTKLAPVQINHASQSRDRTPSTTTSGCGIDSRATSLGPLLKWILLSTVDKQWAGIVDGA